MTLTRFLQFLAFSGLISCTGFLFLTTVSALRFRRRASQPKSFPAEFPQVTLLKPLCGLEPNLEANLESFFLQDYPNFEIIFGTRDGTDAALAVVHKVQRRYPHVATKIVFSGEPDRPSAKVCSLQKMYSVASSNYFIISDSDVEVRPNYLREVVPPLLNPQGRTSDMYLPRSAHWRHLVSSGSTWHVG